MENRLIFSHSAKPLALIIILIILTAAYQVAAQFEYDRLQRVTAITYPLDQAVTVQFRGMTRFSTINGEAKVKRTSDKNTEIEFSAIKMPRPFEVGTGYATYILWAIPPDGRAVNLGELKKTGVADFDSKLNVTTPLQTFALIVTAEPHFLAQEPGKDVLMENIGPPPDERHSTTVSTVTYLPNLHYYFHDPGVPVITEADYSKIPSMVLQARLAAALARVADAGRYAPSDLRSAEIALQGVEAALKVPRDETAVVIDARKAVILSATAEATAILRRKERDNAGWRGFDTGGQLTAPMKSARSGRRNEIQGLKFDLMYETMALDSAERATATFSNKLKETNSENDALRAELEKAKADYATTIGRIAALGYTKTSPRATGSLCSVPTVPLAAGMGGFNIVNGLPLGSPCYDGRGITGVVVDESHKTVHKTSSSSPLGLYSWDSSRSYSKAMPPAYPFPVEPGSQYFMQSLSAVYNTPRIQDPEEGIVRLSRYPNIETKDEVFVKEKFSVQVSLTEEKPESVVKLNSLAGDVTATKDNKVLIPMPLTLNAKKWDIDVVLAVASGDFVFRGENTGTITISRNGDSTSARFNLEAKNISEPQRKSRILVAFYIKSTNAFLMKVEKEVTILQADASSVKLAAKAPRSETSPRKQDTQKPPAKPSPQGPSSGPRSPSLITRLDNGTLGPVVTPPPPAEETPAEPKKPDNLPTEGSPPQDEIEVAAAPGGGASSKVERLSAVIKDEQPDMTVLIFTNMHGQQHNNSLIMITSPHFRNQVVGEFSTNPGLPAIIESKFRELSVRSARDIEGFTETNKPPTATKELLEGLGALFYDYYAPIQFKQTFWRLRDLLGKKFKTIRITTDNPNFPWELLRPRRDSNSPYTQFLGIDFAIGRMASQPGKAEADTQLPRAAVTGMTLVAPIYNDARDLPGATNEAAFLKKLTVFNGMDGVNPMDASLDKLRGLFAKLPSHIIHFPGHGMQHTGADGISSSRMALSDIYLTQDEWRGFFTQVPGNRPLFFMNACELGRSGNYSGLVEGFAPVALESGASGYIGALWSIGDKGADEFAESFYNALSVELKAKRYVSVAELLRATRNEYLKNNDPTFLAYIFYGDPNLKLFIQKP